MHGVDGNNNLEMISRKNVGGVDKNAVVRAVVLKTGATYAQV